MERGWEDKSAKTEKYIQKKFVRMIKTNEFNVTF